MRWASAADMASPVSSISMACFGATLRDSATMGVVQNRPMSTPGVAKVASAPATARSQLATSWQPAAEAAPCTQAITGCGSSTTDIIRVLHSRQIRVKKPRPPSASVRRAVSSRRSCPEQNAGPSAAMTTARTEVSRPSAASASVSAVRSSSDKLLREAGRLRMSHATASSVSRRRTGSLGIVLAAVALKSRPSSFALHLPDAVPLRSRRRAPPSFRPARGKLPASGQPRQPGASRTAEESPKS